MNNINISEFGKIDFILLVYIVKKHMKNFRILLVSSIIFLFTVFSAQAGTRVVVEVEVTKGDNIEMSNEIITFDKDRFRIDFPGPGKDVTDKTSYIMTVNGGGNWVIADKQDDMFYCTEMQTEEFFRRLGSRATSALKFFRVKVRSPTIKKTLEEPGPEIHGYKTTHVQYETTAKGYASLLVVKFEYSVKVIDDLWYTTELEIHPVKKKWMNALAQSGNSLIDKMVADITAKLAGPVLKRETVIDITNVRKKETKTQKKRSVIKSVADLSADELDKVFTMPKCEVMKDNEVEKRAGVLYSADKLML